ncbi:hypothetical protein Hanom_Chr13g01220031 [Helianthus anomalus]
MIQNYSTRSKLPYMIICRVILIIALLVNNYENATPVFYIFTLFVSYLLYDNDICI